MTMEEAKKMVEHPITIDDMVKAACSGLSRAIEIKAAEYGVPEAAFDRMYWSCQEYFQSGDGLADCYGCSFESSEDDIVRNGETGKPWDFNYDREVQDACEWVLEWYDDEFDILAEKYADGWYE